MSEQDSFAVLMSRLKGGDQEASVQIFREFTDRLVRLAHRRLNALIRQKVDPEDVVQSAFRTFFRRQAGGQIRVESWEALWGLLVVITLRKCGHRIDYFRAACRDVQREVAAAPAEDDTAAGWEAIAREPTPSEAAILAETVEQMLDGLDERERQILQRTLKGEGPPQISDALGVSERTVERTLARIRKRLERLRDRQGDG